MSLFPDLPPAWKEERIHDVADLRTSSIDKKSEDGEDPVELCNYVDVYKNNKIAAGLEFMKATATVAQIDRFSINVSDVIITKDSETPDDIGVPAYVAETKPNLVCGYHLTMIRPNEDIVLGSYLFYALESRLSAFQFHLAANGVTRFGLTAQGTKNVRIAFPFTDEQKQIADFLDWKTHQIDTLISKKQQLIEKLREQRIAVITRAVTKGLNPDAPMRDSGIPLLGEVPRHWEVMKYGYRTRIQEGQVDPEDDRYSDMLLIAPNHIESDTGRVFGLSSAQDQAAISGKYLVRNGDVVYSKIRPHLNKVALAEFDGLCSADMYPIRTEHELNSVFLFYWMLAQPFLDYATLSSLRVAMPKLNRESLSSAPLVVPPLEEQEAIVEHLSPFLEKLDALSAKVSEAIDRLTEYRKTLITAATTGKIDVRDIKLPYVA